MSYNTLISTTQLAELLQTTAVLVVDCRFNLMDEEKGHQDYLQTHIPGAIYANLNRDLSGPIIPGQTGRHPLPEPPVFAETLSNWGVDETVQVVAYDDMGGAMAARLWWMLNWLGHENVAVLDGGWQKWTSESRPTENQPPKPAPSTFQIKPSRLEQAGVDQVSAVLHDPQYQLIDARAADRFRGENETLDKKAGHIPGAMNIPFTGNLNEQGCFLSAKELQKRFADELATDAHRDLIVYCGSGVTAAHNILAMTLAGIKNVRLYAGSWSHWITDDKRPIETGNQ